MNTFSIKEALRAGWAIWKSNEKILILSTLIVFIINILADVRTDSALIVAQGIVLTLISILVHIGWTKVLIKLHDGAQPSLHELVEHSALFLKYLCAMILYSLAVFLGLILLIVPGIYIALKYQFSLISIIDKDLPIRAAFDESARITQGHKWKLLGLLLAFLGVNILGLLAVGVGLLVSVPVTMLAYIHVYRKLSATPAEAIPASV